MHSSLEVTDFGRGKGHGVVATAPIKSNTVIGQYAGELINQKQYNERRRTYQQEGINSSYVMGYNSSVFIDATKEGNMARFINSSHRPNLKTEKVNIFLLSILTVILSQAIVNGFPSVILRSTEDIQKGEELTYDYGKGYSKLK